MTFTTVLDERFTGPPSPAWTRYSGVSPASGARFDHAGVTAGGGLRLTAARQPDGTWHGAGVKHESDHLYGRWTVRSRIEAGRGVTLVHLLWPRDTTAAPAEVDFAEDNGGDRNLVTATTHWGDSGAHRQQSVSLAVDLTQWHTWSVTWLPGSIRYQCGRQTIGAVEGDAVPAVPMHLALQTEAWATATTWEHAVDTTTPATVTTYVSRVKVQTWAAAGH